MPQATDELRARWGIDDAPVIRFLEGRGYCLEGDWTWTLPKGQERPTEDEASAIEFLFQEWDFGGWRDPAPTP